MDFKHMTEWLKGKSLTSFLRSHKEKKKEEARLHTAKLHAAISLTQLAAAIAGFATNYTAEAQDITHMTTGGGTLACDQDMGPAVASAATLLTTVCAEAAESLGAKRARVASAVKSGLATQTPIDVITLTATAATCLRGAATLKSRAKAETYFPRNQELLKVGVQTLIIMPSGEKGFKWVRIHLKQRQLTLSFRNKYFGGALTTSKEYKIINVIEEIKDAKGTTDVQRPKTYNAKFVFPKRAQKFKAGDSDPEELATATQVQGPSMPIMREKPPNPLTACQI
ncbi:breast basic conserved 1 [Actinidia rufa]|uniref:Breast basic conserved 1 n=1 Tax=Actinidia rufa TaxID=165716 RepID=A0A7J0E5V3_9ERIC|nr:breast basic conserved 1 [Actinidia rufa]